MNLRPQTPRTSASLSAALLSALLACAACTTDTVGGVDPYNDFSQDNTLPEVSILKPLASQRVSGPVLVEVEASDDLAVEAVQIAIDGTPVIELSVAPYLWTWDTTGLAPGPYQINATAIDKAGNRREDSVRVNVAEACEGGNCAPRISFLRPGEGAAVRGAVELSLDAQDDGEVVTVSLTSSGGLVLQDRQAPWALTWTSDQAPEGDYTWTAIAQDNTGLRSTAERTVFVDRTAPVVTLDSPSEGAVVGDALPFSARIEENYGLVRVEAFVDDQLAPRILDAEPWASSLDLSALPSGPHTFTLLAIDQVGLTGSDSRAIVLDRPPTISFVSPEEGALLEGTVNLEVDAADDLGLEEVFLEVNGQRQGDFDAHGRLAGTPNLAPGPVEITAVAVDGQGQRAQVRRFVTLGDTGGVSLQLERCTPSCAPFDNGVTFSGQVPLQVTANPGDADISTVSYFLGPREVASSGRAPFAVTLDTTLFGNAAVLLRAVAQGPGLSAQVERRVRIDNAGCADDADGDGAIAQRCGGDDCDDDNPQAFPCPGDALGVCEDRRSDDRHCGACGNACGAGEACAQGECRCNIPGCEDGSPEGYNYSAPATWVSDFEVVSGTQGAADLDGDGSPDNALGPVLDDLANLFELDVNSNLDILIETGALSIGAAWPTLAEGRVEDRSGVTLDFFDLVDVDNNPATRGNWRVTRDSFVPGTSTPRTRFVDGDMEGTLLTAGPASVFSVIVPFGLVNLEMRILQPTVNARLSREGQGMRVQDGRMTGYVTLENLLDGFNLFADSQQCTCLDLPEPLVDLRRGFGGDACLRNVNTAQCGFGNACGTLARFCSFIVPLISDDADLDTDGDGVNDAFSASFRWEGRGTRLLGPEAP